MERERGTVLVLTGVTVLVVTLAASAALAPARDVGERQATGTLVGVQGSGPGFHETGNVHMLNGSEIEWRRAAADSYFEVEQLPDGNVAVAFIESGYEECGEFDPPCPHTGYRVIDPGSGVVSEFSFPVRSKRASEVHSVEPLPDGGFAVADMEHERLLVVENGSIAWEWTADSFYEAPPDPTRVDWLHINDVGYIGEDRFLLSVRNANQILVIERGTGVVEVINEDRGEGSEETCRQGGELEDYDGDGEVRCGNPETIHRQHNPHWLGDGAVLVADSENDRVVELHRTPDGWKPVWTLDRAGDLALDWPRDADRLPDGNTLVTDTFNKRLVEINGTGDLVWSVSIEDVPYEADRVPHGEGIDVPTYGDDGSDTPSVGSGTAGGGPSGSETNHDDGPTADGPSGSETSDAGSGDVPVLTTVVVALHAGVPGMPYWVGEVQVFLALVAVVFVVAGLLARYR